MSAAFLDTSALFRRYDPYEPGAARVRALCRPVRRNTIVVARITSVEMASALARKTREGRLLAAERERIWRLFRRHWNSQYQVIAAAEALHMHAEQLLFRHTLRALDAVQISSALAAQAQLQGVALQFWTADLRQSQAARAEGLQVELLT